MPSERDVGGWFDDASRARRIYASKAHAVQQQQRQQQQQQHLAQANTHGGSATALAEAVAAATAEGSKVTAAGGDSG